MIPSTTFFNSIVWFLSVNLVDDNIFLQCLKGLTKYPKPWAAREELHTTYIQR